MRIYILLLLFISFFSYSQDKQIDSLKRVLTEYEKVSSDRNDTLRILTLQQIANYYILYKPDSGIIFAQKAIRYCSQRPNYERFLDKNYLILGVSYATKGFHESAIPTYYKSLSFAQKHHHLVYVALSYKFIGDSFFLRNIFDKAEENYGYALKNYNILGDSTYIKDSYSLLGNVYFSQKKYQKSYKFYLQGKDQANIGLALIYLGKEKQGLAMLNEELEKKKKLNSHFDVVSLNQKLSEYYKNINQFNKSNRYALEAFNLSLKNNFQNEQMLASDILFQNYEKLNDKTNSLKFLKEHQNLMKTITDESQKELMNALKFEYDLRNKKEELKSTTADLQSETKLKYYAIGIATLFLALLGLIVFSYRQTTKSKQLIEEKNTKLEIAQNELTELNQNLEQKVNERTSDLQKANQELIQKNQEIVEAMFKGQTFERKQVAAELHDNLGSQLSAMRWSVLAMNKTSMSVEEREIYDNVLSMMDESYNQIRNISHNLLPQELEKEGLQKAIEKLIHKLNRNQSIEFSLDFSQYIKPTHSSIALEIYAVILELVNNIIRHSKASKAFISFSNTNQNLQIEVIDNGIGLNPTHFEEGIGFRNIKERIAKIGASIKFQNLNGFHAIIKI